MVQRKSVLYWLLWRTASGTRKISPWCWKISIPKLTWDLSSDLRMKLQKTEGMYEARVFMTIFRSALRLGEKVEPHHSEASARRQISHALLRTVLRKKFVNVFLDSIFLSGWLCDDECNGRNRLQLDPNHLTLHFSYERRLPLPMNWCSWPQVRVWFVSRLTTANIKTCYLRYDKFPEAHLSCSRVLLYFIVHYNKSAGLISQVLLRSL